ncbi:MAG: hypothetical protein R3F61_28750 [Myxococcota bacterium]
MQLGLRRLVGAVFGTDEVVADLDGPSVTAVTAWAPFVLPASILLGTAGLAGIVLGALATPFEHTLEVAPLTRWSMEACLEGLENPRCEGVRKLSSRVHYRAYAALRAPHLGMVAVSPRSAGTHADHVHCVLMSPPPSEGVDANGLPPGLRFSCSEGSERVSLDLEHDLPPVESIRARFRRACARCSTGCPDPDEPGLPGFLQRLLT